MTEWSRRIVPAVVGLLLLGALGEMLQAVGAVPPGGAIDGVAATAGVLAALAGVGAVVLVTAWSPAVPATAAAFLVARWLAYDPYYLPGHRRASDGGLLASGWVALLVAASVVVTPLVARRSALRALASLVLILVAFSALAARAGH